MSDSTLESIAINVPVPVSSMVDPVTSGPTKAWWYVFRTLVTRTGGPVGIDSATVQASVAAALAAAGGAQDTANLGLMEDDDVFAVAMPQINGLQVALALSDDPDRISVDAIVLLSLALQDETP